MRSKIAYMGWLGHQNIGDEACFTAIKKMLPKESDITCWDINPWNKKFRPDMSIVGGGTLLDLGGDCRVNAIADLRGNAVPTVFWGTGVLGNGKQLSAKTAALLNSAEFIGVRGPRSLSRLLSCGIESASVIGDPAFLLTTARANSYKSDTVAINIGDARGNLWGTEKAVVTETNVLIKRITDYGLRVVLFPMWPSDMRYINMVDKKVGVIIRPWGKSIANMMDFMKSCRLVIGMKLHSVVLSAASRTPFVSIAYREKCLDFAESLDLGGWAVKSDGKHLGNKLFQLLKESERYTPNIVDKITNAYHVYKAAHDNLGARVRKLLKEE